MTTTEIPAATLRAAAQRLRELAEKATGGPWRLGVYQHDTESPRGLQVVVWGEPPAMATEVARGWPDVEPNPAMNWDWSEDHGPWLVKPDAAWIALMSPAIAEPLAAWLEHEADLADRIAHLPHLPSGSHPPHALARVILGGSHV